MANKKRSYFQSVAKGVKLMATWNVVTSATVANGNKFFVRTLY